MTTKWELSAIWGTLAFIAISTHTDLMLTVLCVFMAVSNFAAGFAEAHLARLQKKLDRAAKGENG